MLSSSSSVVILLIAASLLSSSLSFSSAKRVGAIVGDYGRAIPHSPYTSTGAKAVSDMVINWANNTPNNQDFVVITTGDNNYPSGSQATIDANIGQFYCPFIQPYSGSTTWPSCQALTTTTNNTKTTSIGNRFFPTLGNIDGDASNNFGAPYFNYFKNVLPPASSSAPASAKGRYYDFKNADGSVHFFAINSNEWEFDGTSENSTQALWLKSALANSSSPFRIVYFHYCPYSYDDKWGPKIIMRWPFAEWGATTVVSGHVHAYSRIEIDGFTYLTNGLSGTPNFYGLNKTLAVDGSSFSASYPGLKAFYNSDYGAQTIDVSDDQSSMTITFVSVGGSYRDSVSFARTTSPSKTTPITPRQQNKNNKGTNKNKSSDHGRTTGLLIGLVVGVFVCFIFLAISYLYTRSRDTRERSHPLRNRQARIAQERGRQMLEVGEHEERLMDM